MHRQSRSIRQIATATGFVRDQVLGKRGPAAVLGAFPTACYLQLPDGTVIALLCTDAVRLPIGLVLPVSSGRLPLDGVTEAALIDGELRLGALRVGVGSLRSAALAPVGRPDAESLAGCRPWQQAALATAQLPADALATLFAEPATGVGRLLGAGPGLTPSGDDLLCGVLAGAVLFDQPCQPIRRAVTDQLASRPRATTSLSRQLLLRAAVGEGIEQLTDLGRALCTSEPARLATALARLDLIGHSSGAALGWGVLAMAERALPAVRPVLSGAIG